MGAKITKKGQTIFWYIFWRVSYALDIEIYDIAKCSDKLEYFNTANDLFKAGVNDDKFIVVANSNMESNVAIKTPWGTKTERMKMNNVEMQGTVLAGLKCAISIDTIGKEALEKEHDILYNYKIV